MSEKPISALRRCMIEEHERAQLREKTRNDNIRHVRTFTSMAASPTNYTTAVSAPRPTSKAPPLSAPQRTL
jgi:hypothetical protein